MGNVCGVVGGRGDRKEEQLAFMTCLLKVKSQKQGWESSVRRVVKSCKGVRFQMDSTGMVEINGIGNPEIVLKKISRSSNLELHWYQFGQCSANLFMQQQKKKNKDDMTPIPIPIPIPIPNPNYNISIQPQPQPTRYT